MIILNELLEQNAVDHFLTFWKEAGEFHAIATVALDAAKNLPEAGEKDLRQEEQSKGKLILKLIKVTREKGAALDVKELRFAAKLLFDRHLSQQVQYGSSCVN